MIGVDFFISVRHKDSILMTFTGSDFYPVQSDKNGQVSLKERHVIFLKLIVFFMFSDRRRPNHSSILRWSDYRGSVSLVAV